MAEWAETYHQIEKQVISGNHQECHRLLNLVNPRALPRKWACRIAQLASRVHHSLYALKALHRFIHPESQFAEPATEAEKIVYAYALLNLGAAHEALEILSTVSPEQNPESLLQTALAHFTLWNYPAAIPVLKQFVAHPEVPSYRCLVGKVNLAAAHIYCRDGLAAATLLNELKAECAAGGFGLLLGNCHELLAQVHFSRGRYDEALAELDLSRELLKNQGGIYSLFTQKWILLCHCFKADSPEGIEDLRAFRQQALRQGHWETIRECDLFEAILSQNETLFRKVIIGTPSEHYRHRARVLYGKPLKAIGQYHLTLGTADPDLSAPVFDPYQPQGPGGLVLHDKPHLLKVFEALTIDFYKPSHIGALFKAVYAEEKFNPYTSPPRVLQLLKRLDGWFLEARLPLRVEFKKSEFALKSLSPIRILIQRGKKLSAEDGKLTALKKAFARNPFSCVKVAKAIGISKTSAQRLIKKAIADGKVEVIGRGRGVVYRFAQPVKGKSA